jgi:single-stranded-DNA-specific exonuclease
MPVDQEHVRALALEHKLCAPLARCLLLRGIEQREKIQRFLHPDFDSFYDPYDMDEMRVAVERLQQATQSQEHIRVVTDYDVDGTTSSLILQSVLALLGHRKLSYHVPHRMEEGYGFSVHAARQAASDGVKLIIAADIGIRDHQAVREAQQLGVDVLIVDHHLPPGQDVPQDACAVLCPPKANCHYPNPQLAACGVSLKLAQALLEQHPKRKELLESLLKLAAMGTVADVVDLAETENRAIVSLGLRSLNSQAHRPGLSALLEIARLRPGEIDATALAFKLGPRINAAGRVASAQLVIELLLCPDPVRARKLAQELERMNDERKLIQQRMLDTALAEVGDNAPPFVVISHVECEHWHRGVAGIVAARLRDTLNRPVAVIAETPKGATGSIRSTPQIHAVQALQHASALLERFGGHPAAAGFSLPTSSIPELRALLQESALQQLDGERFVVRREYELRLHESMLSPSLFDELAKLAPHGKGNPEPRILLEVERLPRLEQFKDEHLRGRLSSSHHRPIDLLWWSGAKYAHLLQPGRSYCLFGNLERSSWQGSFRSRFIIEDASLA